MSAAPAGNGLLADPGRPGALRSRGGPPADLLVSRVRCLDPRSDLDEIRDLVIREGRIAELAEPGSKDQEAGEVHDGEGLLALPAFVDPHVHLRTPGEEHKEDLETGTRAAAAGGYCQLVAMANTRPPLDSPEDIQALLEHASREASVPVGFVATVTRGMGGVELTEMAELRDAGAVGFSDDGLPIASARVLRRALQYQRLSGGTIALHEEDPELSAGGHMNEGLASTRLGVAGIPAVAESTMVERDCQIAALEGGRIHLQHLSCHASVEAVARARAAGVAVSAEASPHHLVLTDEDVAELDTSFKMNPPLRSSDDRGAVREGLRDGTLDCVATDHAPHAPPDKEVPFEEAAMGTTGLETSFAVLHTELVLPGLLDLATLVERMTAGLVPFGFEPPALAPGAEANVCLVDPEASWIAGEDGWESRSGNCAFAGRSLRGRILLTVAAGSVAYRLPSFAIGAAP